METGRNHIPALRTRYNVLVGGSLDEGKNKSFKIYQTNMPAFSNNKKIREN